MILTSANYKYELLLSNISGPIIKILNNTKVKAYYIKNPNFYIYSNPFNPKLSINLIYLPILNSYTLIEVNLHFG